MIDLKDALKVIHKKGFKDNNGSFKILFLTCHRYKQTGGEWIALSNACGCGLPPNCRSHEMIGIRDMETGKPYAVHNRLIFQFNNEDVFWV